MSPCCVALLLAIVSAADAIGPRVASSEDLVEQADAWLNDHDENDDGKISLSEMGPVLDEMRARSSLSGSDSAQLTPELFMNMADADGDGAADKAELVGLLKRMKGFDAGHIKREEAKVPNPSASSYGESHEERMRKKRRSSRKRKSAQHHTLQPKDEI